MVFGPVVAAQECGGGNDDPGGDEQGEVQPVGEGGAGAGVGGGVAEADGDGDRCAGLAGLRGGQVGEVEVALVGGGQDAGHYRDAQPRRRVLGTGR
jgi:hypothetical protein